MITGYGQWEYQVQANGTEGDKGDSWTRLAFAGLKLATTVHSTTAVTTVYCTT
jgi:predicted porin